MKIVDFISTKLCSNASASIRPLTQYFNVQNFDFSQNSPNGKARPTRNAFPKLIFTLPSICDVVSELKNTTFVEWITRAKPCIIAFNLFLLINLITEIFRLVSDRLS